MVGEGAPAILTPEMASHPVATPGDSSSEALDAGRAVELQGPRGQAGSAPRQQGMEVEMNRFHSALREVRHELRDARRGAVCVEAEEVDDALHAEDVLLRDSLVLLEVERTILDERLPAEHALSKVLEERRRLARLVGGDPTSPTEVASLMRAFSRVIRALDLDAGADERDFPDARSTPPSAR